MKIKLTLLVIYSLVAFCSITTVVEANSPSHDDSILRQSFDLAGERSQETQYFIMETKIVNYALDGTRLGTDIYKLHLKCVPAKMAGKTEWCRRRILLMALTSPNFWG